MKIFLILVLLVTVGFAEEPTKKELADKLEKEPANTWALYNLGLLNFLDEEYKEAIKHWEALKKLEPESWQTREKLIQAYWGAGLKEGANSEIAELKAARNSGKHEELNKKRFFICDQFQVGKVRAFALEYFELKGKRPLAWKFILRSGDETMDQYYSVGSYAATNEYARASGEIGPEDRQYHLDGYDGDGSHQTFGFYKNRPDYAKIREEVRRILEGQTKEISSTTPAK